MESIQTFSKIERKGTKSMENISRWLSIRKESSFIYEKEYKFIKQNKFNLQYAIQVSGLTIIMMIVILL
jgi:hypothetical protein